MQNPRGMGWSVAGWMTASFGLWLILTSTFAPNEMITGVGASLITAAAAAAVHRHGDVASLRGIRGRDLVQQVAAIPIRYVYDLGVAAAALARRIAGRQVRGSFVDVEVRGHRRVALHRGYQTFATVLVSLSPNAYIVDFDDEQGTATVHQLRRSSASSLEQLMRRP
jgi:multisubunit Na+/H+ antiporter MnhE subunit